MVYSGRAVRHRYADWHADGQARLILIPVGFERYLRVVQREGEHAAVSLMRMGMMGCTPTLPSVAISIGVLKMYYFLRRRAPRLGIQPFVRALCDTYNVRPLFSSAIYSHGSDVIQCHYRPYLREQFAAAFDTYLNILREVERQVDVALGQDIPNWRALNSCAPCNYTVRSFYIFLRCSDLTCSSNSSRVKSRSSSPGLLRWTAVRR